MNILNSDNPWVLVAINVISWVVVWGVLETFFFDGRLLNSIIPAIAGGIASGLVSFYFHTQ